MRHKTLFRVHCPVPGPSRSDPPGVLPGKVDKICGGHGQGETPGPIPNPEAKALHGDGTAPERVWESSAPPLSHDTVPPGRAPTGSRGDPLFPPRTHGRHGTGHGRPLPPHSHLLISPHIHSYPLDRIPIAGPRDPDSMIGGAVLSHAGGSGGRHDDGPRREAQDPHRGRGRARRTARRARTGRGKRGHTGPAAGRAGRGNGEGAAGRRPCAVSVMDRRRGYAVHTSSERMTECI